MCGGGGGGGGGGGRKLRELEGVGVGEVSGKCVYFVLNPLLNRYLDFFVDPEMTPKDVGFSSGTKVLVAF